MKVYKVTTEKLSSLVICIRGITVEYKVGEWTFPTIPNSGIFVFLDKGKAIQYARSNGTNNRVWECEAPKAFKIFKIADYDAMPAMKAYWGRNINRRNYKYACINAPPGCYVVPKIKLIKEVV